MRGCFAGSRKILMAGDARISKLQGLHRALQGAEAIDQTVPATLLEKKLGIHMLKKKIKNTYFPHKCQT